MTLIEQAIKRRNDEAWVKRPVFSLKDVSIEGIKEFRRLFSVLAPYRGKTSFEDGFYYCPYIPLYISYRLVLLES